MTDQNGWMRYYADAGSLAIGTDGLTVLFPNGVGDGDFKVLITDRDTERRLNPRWHFITSFTAGKNCHVYEYDCSTDIVLADLPVGRYGVYAKDNGYMWLEKWD